MKTIFQKPKNDRVVKETDKDTALVGVEPEFLQ